MQHNEYKSILNSLRKIRMERMLDQLQVATALGISSTTKLSRWESGKTLPSLVNAFRLAGLYHVLVEDLFKELYDKIREEVIRDESQAARAPSSVPNQSQ